MLSGHNYSDRGNSKRDQAFENQFQHLGAPMTNRHSKMIAALLIVFGLTNLSLADETAFTGVKLADAKGKQADARLIFSDANSNIVVRVADRDVVLIPYNQLDKFSYEYTKKHRITQGAVVKLCFFVYSVRTCRLSCMESTTSRFRDPDNDVTVGIAENQARVGLFFLLRRVSLQ